MKSHERYALLMEQYPGGVPEDVKAAFVAECRVLEHERAAQSLAKQNGGHEGKILYVGSIVLFGLCGLWTLAGIMVFMGLLWLVLLAFARFPLVTILVGFAGFLYLSFLYCCGGMPL